jgi:ubiquinone/menaquinone biosynthesis C-methylase UbiE
MSQYDAKNQIEKVVTQFTKQASPFVKLKIHQESLDLLVEMSGVDDKDTVLDVACGPGLVACEFALHASHVTGIDITEAMIDLARKKAEGNNTKNVSWKVSNALPLPFDNDSFSRVITRYSFHHFLEPEKALSEMIRVCKPGGTVLVADVCVPDENSAQYDRMEKFRDNSHVHALTESEFVKIFQLSGLMDLKQAEYGLDTEVNHLLDASSHSPSDREKIMDMITSDVGVNSLGVNARYERDNLVFTFPITVFTGKKEI